jgi:hypothetical protein
VSSLTFRELTAADIHPVALNILNMQRDGRYLIPSPSADMPVLPGNGTYGRELLAQQVIPTESNGWADASSSPTFGDAPAMLAGVTNTHTWSRLLQEVNIGYFELENTRISKHRDIFNSTLGIYNPLEHSIGGLAALMPTIDINTQRNSGGIGNAWDFFDRQRVLHASARWSLVAGGHTLQSGIEYRRVRLDGEYMSRTNGDLDYDNWVFFFTGGVPRLGRCVGRHRAQHPARTVAASDRHQPVAQLAAVRSSAHRAAVGHLQRVQRTRVRESGVDVRRQRPRHRRPHHLHHRRTAHDATRSEVCLLIAAIIARVA